MKGIQHHKMSNNEIGLNKCFFNMRIIRSSIDEKGIAVILLCQLHRRFRNQAIWIGNSEGKPKVPPLFNSRKLS